MGNGAAARFSSVGKGTAAIIGIDWGAGSSITQKSCWSGDRKCMFNSIDFLRLQMKKIEQVTIRTIVMHKIVMMMPAELASSASTLAAGAQNSMSNFVVVGLWNNPLGRHVAEIHAGLIGNARCTSAVSAVLNVAAPGQATEQTTPEPTAAVQFQSPDRSCGRPLTAHVMYVVVVDVVGGPPPGPPIHTGKPSGPKRMCAW